MDKRPIHSYIIEVKYKKGKSLVSVCLTAMEMNNTPRVVRTLQAQVYGVKSAAYKSSDKNLWITKILQKIYVGESFHYNDENYRK